MTADQAEELKEAASSKIAGFFTSKQKLKRGLSNSDSFASASKGTERFSDHFLCPPIECADLFVSSIHKNNPRFRKKCCADGECDECGVLTSIEVTGDKSIGLAGFGIKFRSGTNFVSSVKPNSPAGRATISASATDHKKGHSCWLGSINGAEVCSEQQAKATFEKLKKTNAKKITFVFFVLKPRFEVCQLEWSEADTRWKEYRNMPRGGGDVLAIDPDDEAYGEAKPTERMQMELVEARGVCSCRN